MTAKIHPSLTPDRILKACERRMTTLDDPGFCIRCGNEQGGCEPDARRYHCEACGEHAVYGAEELLILMGWLSLGALSMSRLREALQGLVDRLDKIHDDPLYQSVWAVNQLHAGPYAGPTYVEALARARAALMARDGEPS